RDDQAHAASGVGHGCRRSDRVRSSGAGDLHDDAGFSSRVSRVRREDAAGVRGRLTMNCSHLDWPFFDDRHREMGERLDVWAADHLQHGDGDVDAQCRALVKQLGDAGWLRHAVAGTRDGGMADAIDTRSICLLRETLAWHHGLADFAFAMQGLGSGAISLHGSDAQRERYLPRVARRALHEGLQRATSRTMFGHPLADFQLTQAKLAQMATTVDSAALLTYRAAWLRDQGRNVTQEAAMAKMAATEGAQQVIDAAVQLWGGAGVVSGNTVETLYREIRALRIYEGATEVQQLIIARELLKGT